MKAEKNRGSDSVFKNYHFGIIWLPIQNVKFIKTPLYMIFALYKNVENGKR